MGFAARVTRGRRASVAPGPVPAADPAVRPAPVLPNVLQFMQLLWAVDHGLQRTSKGMLRRLGVTGPQPLALRLIGQFPSISAGDLAALLHVHPSTLTGILARLLEQRLILRAVDTRDARRSVLRLSRRGMRSTRCARVQLKPPCPPCCAARRWPISGASRPCCGSWPRR